MSSKGSQSHINKMTHQTKFLIWEQKNPETWNWTKKFWEHLTRSDVFQCLCSLKCFKCFMFCHCLVLCPLSTASYWPWVSPDRDVKRCINLIYVLLPLLVGLISLWRSWRAHEDHKPPIGRGRSLRGPCRWTASVCVCVRACLCVCSDWPRAYPDQFLTWQAYRAAYPSGPPSSWALWVRDLFRVAAVGGSPALQHGPSVSVMRRRSECARAHVYVSVWCVCPSGLQIMVNVPTGSFHRSSSGQCQCQVTEPRRINQDGGLKRGRRAGLCHQSERHLMWHAHKRAMLPVWSTDSPWQRRAAAAFKMEPPFWMSLLFSQPQGRWWTSRYTANRKLSDGPI